MIPLAKRAAIASVACAVTLGLVKSWAAWTTGSVAVLASLADSLLDLVASLVTLFAVHLAAQPADHDHRFGHGKAEALAALFQVALIAVSAFFIFGQAVSRFSDGAQSSEGAIGIGVSVFAIIVTLALTSYQKHIVAQTRSVAIGADRVHYQSDLLLNSAVIAALVLDQYLGLTGADPLFGIAIGLWLLFGAWRAAEEAINQLMDKEWPEEKRLRFVEVAARHPEIRHLHDLRTRTSGNKDFVQFHMWMDAHLTVAEAHEVVERIEASFADAFPDCEVFIHIDPEGRIDEPDNPLVEANELAKLKARMS